MNSWFRAGRKLTRQTFFFLQNLTLCDVGRRGFEMRVPLNARSAPKDATGNGTNAPLYSNSHNPVSGAAPSPPPRSTPPSARTVSSPPAIPVDSPLLLPAPALTPLPRSHGVAGMATSLGLGEEAGAGLSPTERSAATSCCCWEEGGGEGWFFFCFASQAGRSMVTFRRSVKALCTYSSVTCRCAPPQAM